MNLQSILLLALVLGLFLIVGYRYVVRQKKSRSCESCNCGCSGCESCH